MLTLHHVAIATKEFEKYVELFEKMGMSVRRTMGEKPKRQLWFHEGIQINELPETAAEDRIDHIALGTDEFEGTMGKAFANGCTPVEQKDHWFNLPDGIKVEIMKK